MASSPPSSPPPPPPSGFRHAVDAGQPLPAAALLGAPASTDADGAPVYVGSAHLPGAVQPCKVAPHLAPPCRVPCGGEERAHTGRFDVLPLDARTMEWVRAARGRVPPGRRPVEGGFEDSGALFHARAPVPGREDVLVPGRTGEHLRGARIAFGGREIVVRDHYEILCWR